MHAPRITPSIEVTIGRETRLYHAFITTAPATFDAPATVTLHTAPLSDVRASRRTRTPSTSHPRMLRGGSCSWTAPSWTGSGRATAKGPCLAPGDPVLIGLTTLQHWLWNRIGSPAMDFALADA